MSWVLIALAAWLAVSMLVALLVVRAIRMADREASSSDPSPEHPRRLHLARPHADVPPHGRRVGPEPHDLGRVGRG